MTLAVAERVATESRPISSIVVGTRHRRDLGDVDALAKSIADVGLLHPIVVTPDCRLIAGQRRLEACRKLRWAEVPVRVVDLAEIVRGELAENAIRKDFLPTEIVDISKAIRPLEEAAAKERQVSNLKQGHTAPVVAICHNGDEGKTRDKVAACFSIGGRTLDKAEHVVEAAETEPEKYSDLVDLMDRTGKVNGAYKQLEKRKQAEQIAAEPPPMPTGPFRVIVADPPWPYKKRVADPTHRASLPYPEMTLDDIKALPVGRLAADDCVLWLWTTNAHVRQAFEVLDAWGFEQKTILTWVKDRMGTGDWLRGQTEHCLMAVRGKPTVLLTNQTTVLHARLREHSRKPDEFYAMVEALCPGSKVELFSRAERPGWVVHGSDTGAFSLN